MKIQIPLTSALVGTLLFMGCSKAEQVQLPAAVPESSFAEQMTLMLPLMGDDRFLHVKYEHNLESGQPTPVFYFVPREESQPSSRAIVCKSDSEVAFARCCDAWLEANEGKCLRVWQDGGTYYADDNC